MLKRWFGKNKNGDRIATDAIAAYEASRDEFEVIAQLKEALARGLQHVALDRVYTFLGAAYSDVGLRSEAEEAYEAALRHNSNNATALSNLGSLLERRGEHGRARELYDRSIAAKPNNGFAYNNLGLLLLQQGSLADARRALERACELNGTLAVAAANLARCCASMGDFAAAQKAFLRASQLGYSDVDGLKSDLDERRLSVPPVYFDEAAFFRLVRTLFPRDDELHGRLERAIAEPQKLYDELISAGRSMFLTDYLVARALPWMLFSEELQLRGVAIRGTSRSLESWIELLRPCSGNAVSLFRRPARSHWRPSCEPPSPPREAPLATIGGRSSCSISDCAKTAPSCFSRSGRARHRRTSVLCRGPSGKPSPIRPSRV